MRRSSGHLAFSAASGLLLATAARAQLVLTEIHYNPPAPTAFEIQLGHDDADDFEFLEIANLGTGTVALTNVALLEGVTFSFSGSHFQYLAPGARLVVVNKLAAFRARYPSVTAIAGVFSGNLSNSGETLAWRQPSGSLEYLTFGDGGMWPKLADGRGWSLHREDPNLPAANPAAWRASLWIHGSPAAADPARAGIVINEILSHTDPPLADMLELHNRSGQAVNLGGWRLSDDHDALDKFVIPEGSVLAAGGYWVVTESQSLYLSAAAGAAVRVEDVATFSAQFLAESFGRWPNGCGAWHPQVARSPGAANHGVRVPRVVITEIQYNPTGPDATWEYLELANLEPFTLSLRAWRVNLGTDYVFPASTQLAPGRTLLVVPFDPAMPEARAHFMSAWGMPADTPLVGITTGRLSDAGTFVGLNSPDEAPSEEPDFFPPVVEDLVFYAPRSPWPVAAGGQGQSLHRADRRTAGTLSTAWLAGAPSPGRIPFYDEDHDFIADDWELRHFGSRATAQGDQTDSDQDAFPDRHEYVAGTHPLDPLSRLVVTLAIHEAATQSFRLSWAAVTNVRYFVEQAPQPGGVWTPASAVVSGPSVLLPSPPTPGPLVYRVRVAP